jgi:DNA invertase Pin-like site-specific DNA recombinase
MSKAARMRAALYLRVSTGRQAEKDLSLPDQETQLRAYCAQKGWEIYRVYEERGASGRDDKRQVFQEMIADGRLKDHPFDVILTLTTSRFFRDAHQARVYKHKLAKHGIKVIAMHQETADDPMGGFIEGIFELIDQYESEMNGFHTLRAMKENARKGYYNGSMPRYGFKAMEVKNE